MPTLDAVSVSELQSALDDADTGKAVKRLMVALAYKDGVDVATLSGRYGIPSSTIYYWLDRFDDASVSEAATDDVRPGRPPELTAEQRESAGQWLTAPPSERGLDADEWTPALLRDHIDETFDVDYSTAHVQRLLSELDSKN